MAQRHEQSDLELVGVHQPRDDLATRHLLSRAAHPIGNDAGERRRDARARELFVGLREQRTRYFEIGGGEIAVGLRLVDVEARDRRAGRTQPLELALEALQVDARAVHPRRLFGARQRQLAHIQTRHDGPGRNGRARLRDPLQPAGHGRGEIGGIACAHQTGRMHGGCELSHLRIDIWTAEPGAPAAAAPPAAPISSSATSNGVRSLKKASVS